MAAYPFKVQIAYNVVSAVLSEWQQQPYRWLKERDIQAEIAGRLSQIFTLQGEGLVGKGLKWARSDAIQDQSWSRVSCEPYVGYEFNSEPHWCFPDIVIWADDRSRNKGPGGDTSTPWPIAWACELKYGSSNKGEWDVKKLRLLIEQGKIEYGCAINIHFETGADHVSVNWRKEIVNQKRSRRLWVGNVAVPKKPDVT